MGNIVARVRSLFSGFTRDQRVLMLGLDAAGKTTVLYQLKLSELAVTVPTFGFNVENLKYKGLDLTIWDVGGQDKIRALWRHYLVGTDALIFVVDANDSERLELARDELHKLLDEPDLANAQLLVYANKLDLPHSMSPRDIADALKLSSQRTRKWHVQGTVARTGDGLYEGLDWLAAALKGTK